MATAETAATFKCGDFQRGRIRRREFMTAATKRRHRRRWWRRRQARLSRSSAREGSAGGRHFDGERHCEVEERKWPRPGVIMGGALSHTSRRSPM